jgi:hypothetical protein
MSKKRKPPGADQTYREAEAKFFEAARGGLPKRKYDIKHHPNDLRAVFASKEDGGQLGMVPDFCITSKKTKRQLFVEIKKQKDGGNADERACRHYTIGFLALMKEKYGYDYHPFVTIFCESLATNRRYTEKVKHLIPAEHYHLWVRYEKARLIRFLKGRCAAWLD